MIPPVCALRRMSGVPAPSHGLQFPKMSRVFRGIRRLDDWCLAGEAFIAAVIRRKRRSSAGAGEAGVGLSPSGLRIKSADWSRRLCVGFWRQIVAPTQAFRQFRFFSHSDRLPIAVRHCRRYAGCPVRRGIPPNVGSASECVDNCRWRRSVRLQSP